MAALMHTAASLGAWQEAFLATGRTDADLAALAGEAIKEILDEIRSSETAIAEITEERIVDAVISALVELTRIASRRGLLLSLVTPAEPATLPAKFSLCDSLSWIKRCLSILETMLAHSPAAPPRIVAESLLGATGAVLVLLRDRLDVGTPEALDAAIDRRMQVLRQAFAPPGVPDARPQPAHAPEPVPASPPAEPAAPAAPAITPLDRAQLGAALMSFDRSAYAIRTAMRPLQDALQPLVDALGANDAARATLLAHHGVEERGRCSQCDRLILAGDPSSTTDGQRLLCLDCTPTLADALAALQDLQHCMPGAGALSVARQASIDSLSARIATEGPDAKAVTPPPSGLAIVHGLERQALDRQAAAQADRAYVAELTRQEVLDGAWGRGAQVSAAIARDDERHLGLGSQS